MVAKLNRQDEGKSDKGRRASDRGAYSRFSRAVAEAEMLRFVKPDLTADRLFWSINEDAIANAQLCPKESDVKAGFGATAPIMPHHNVADGINPVRQVQRDHQRTEPTRGLTRR